LSPWGISPSTAATLGLVDNINNVQLLRMRGINYRPHAFRVEQWADSR
jgi:hypothetical protein